MYTIGIDFGGGSSKATLLDTSGKIIATATVEYPTAYPNDGWAEQNPKHWYDAVCENIRLLCRKSGISGSEITAIAPDAATHTAVLCDGDFKPLMPSIYWTDTRSAKQADELEKTHGDFIRKITAHSPGTIWTLPQLIWLKENRPDIFRRIRYVMFAKDYIRYRLTGNYATDFIEAQGSMLFDVRRREWSSELCALAGIDADMLPPVVKPEDIVGCLTKEAAEATGLSQKTVVVCGATDTVMEVYASGASETGDMTVKMATAGRICVLTEKPYPHRDLVNYSHLFDGFWYPGTATKSCAASYRWYRDCFGGDYKSLDVEAAKIPVGCGGLMFHPYLTGELTPYADPSLCGSFTGIRAGHTKAHFNRAVLEGVALSLTDCLFALERIGIPHSKTASIIGGGAGSPLWRQILADALGIELVLNECSDSSFGSAMLAASAVGGFADLRDAQKKCIKRVCSIKPDMANHEIYLELYKRYVAIHDALAPVYHNPI